MSDTEVKTTSRYSCMKVIGQGAVGLWVPAVPSMPAGTQVLSFFLCRMSSKIITSASRCQVLKAVPGTQ